MGEVFGDFERGGVRAAVVAGCDQPPCCAKPRTRAGSTRLRALDFLVGAAYEIGLGPTVFDRVFGVADGVAVVV
ncbi:hypothetical protein AB0900_31040 [Streptomyces cellulosae]|uniref:hypothetical protein n=1 Tax=Streptomyces albogriseolus TaxID=1887 RepID=UPI00345F50C7